MNVDYSKDVGTGSAGITSPLNRVPYRIRMIEREKAREVGRA